ncbi:MAG TPA: peptidoglycan-binding domain-containing protein [Ktedonobacteraceae bacterium]|nr:peptidoglycan-binding domain-containing protein [Ktedonobacteraceae bacterium]
MFQTQSTSDKPKKMRWFLPLLSGLLVVAVLVGALLISFAARGGAHAASATNAAVSFADSHWNCGNAACTFRVAAGSPQPDYQCAEFVARSLAAVGKVPGLTPNSSQSAYGSYRARNGRTYDLLWVGVDASGINDEGRPGLYQYLTENGVGVNIGNAPSRATPGDVTFHFEGQGHTGLLVQAGSNAVADFHNNARFHNFYTEGYPTIIVHIGGKLPPPPPVCPATIQNGSTGSLVASLQNELDSLYSKKAFPNSPFNFHPLLAKDGQFGTLTANAVKDFQKKKGLTVDGIVGPMTWHALGNC